jgi:TRAP-type C4-dicarboxylate transport system substrate-binding protein
MKKMNSKIFCTVLIVALFILTLSVSLYAADYKIRVANPVAPDHSWGRAAVVFKEEVEKLSGGKIAVDVHHAGALGKVRETMEMVRMGTLETALGGWPIFSGTSRAWDNGIAFLWKDLTRLFVFWTDPWERNSINGYCRQAFTTSGFLITDSAMSATAGSPSWQ